jgi:hypothetical protein
MGRGRTSKYEDPDSYRPEPPPHNATEILGAALLGSEFKKMGSALLVKFDEPRDFNIVRKMLLQVRDSYEPPRDIDERRR